MQDIGKKFLRPFRKNQNNLGSLRKSRPSMISMPADRELDFLQALVMQTSASEDILGVMAVQRLVADAFVNLGFEVQTIRNPVFASGDLLIAEIPGATGQYVNLVMHADTVLSTVDAGSFSFDKKDPRRAFGSGIIDNKGGIVVALSGVRKFLESTKKLKLGLRIICSPNEEVGSVGFLDIYKSLSKDAALVLGFEPGLSNGSIVHSRRGNRWYTIKVIGREAHA